MKKLLRFLLLLLSYSLIISSKNIFAFFTFYFREKKIFSLIAVLERRLWPPNASFFFDQISPKRNLNTSCADLWHNSLRNFSFPFTNQSRIEQAIAQYVGAFVTYTRLTLSNYLRPKHFTKMISSFADGSMAVFDFALIRTHDSKSSFENC